MDKKLEKLKVDYKNIEIPDELDNIVNTALKKRKKKKTSFKWIYGTAAAIMLFLVTLNTNQSFANTLSNVPGIGEVIKVFTFVEFKVEDNNHHAEIKVPAISNSKNKSLEQSLNEKYLTEGQQLYDDFMAEIKSMEELEGGHLGIESGYVVKTDNENILAIGRYVVNTVGSSSTTFQHDVIDKQREVLLTLPALFKNDSYIEIISENIKEQMKQQMQDDPSKVYWFKGVALEYTIEEFESIADYQDFYINNENKLVISFNKYDVAPGYMGVVEFVIPTEILSNILVGDEYIK